ncbi:hypothetical protein EU527_07480 [Candidatus Thorarchaeota archaeon]|nr:MAG: hypothetical protein EU527_07480 [Candidatus Thorarchaeota archaeon]
MEKIDETTTDWTHIIKLNPNSKNINLRFLVLDIKQSRHVFSKSTGKENELLECIVGDCSGIITLVLWNDDIDSIKIHHTYSLRNGRINLYDECMTLSKGSIGQIQEFENPIEDVDKTVDMSKPFMGYPKRKPKPRSLTGRSFDGRAGRNIRRFCGRKSF